MIAVMPMRTTAMPTATSARQQPVRGEEHQAGGDRRGDAAVAREQPAVAHAEERQIERGASENLGTVGQQWIDEIACDGCGGGDRRRRRERPAPVRAPEE